jgi:hypothetical protein
MQCYTPLMKAYVLTYRDKEGQQEHYSGPTPQNILYSKEPKWTMEYRGAVDEHSILEQMDVHLGEHYCVFSIEKLSTGECAIACLDHPDCA